MDTRRYGAPPLLLPYAHHPEAPASATFLQHSLQASYLAAQTQGRMISVVTWPDRHWIEETTDATPTPRTISSNTWDDVFTVKAHLPPYASAIGCTLGYTVYGGSGIPGLVFHRLVVVDQAATTVTGPIRFDEIDTAELGFVPDFTGGIFSFYDQGISTGGCFADVDGLSKATNSLYTITLQAFCVDGRGLAVEASASSRTTNQVTAVVPSGHLFTVGVSMWTEGFDAAIPVGSATPVDAVTGTTIEWTQAGGDDADFGTGTIYSADGQALPYRPAAYSVWYEVT